MGCYPTLNEEYAMAANIHLDIEGIKGETTSEHYRDMIEVSAWAWGVINPAAVSAGGGGTGKSHFQDFSFTHHYDRASPLLMLGCASGKHFRKATLHEARLGGEQAEFLTITFEEIQITAVQPRDEGAGPIEAVTFSAAKFHVSYRAQKPDGTLDAPVTMSWDSRLNREV
jgi:type VI secretion system secreted protein Hcp